jgi:hypothetical protein
VDFFLLILKKAASFGLASCGFEVPFQKYVQEFIHLYFPQNKLFFPSRDQR